MESVFYQTAIYLSGFLQRATRSGNVRQFSTPAIFRKISALGSRLLNKKELIATGLLMILWFSNSYAQDPWLIKDVNATGTQYGPVGNASSFESSPGGKFMYSANGLAFFTADDGVHGIEMWRTDGTTAGTYMLADITPGAGATTFTDIYEAGSLLYFTTGGGGNITLWRTDGTTAGTYAIMSDTNVHDIKSGSGLNDGVLNYSTINGSLYYFTVRDAEPEGYHDRIYQTDGTVNGTSVWYDAGVEPANGMAPGGSSTYGNISKIISVGSSIYVVGLPNLPSQDFFKSTGGGEPVFVMPPPALSTIPVANPSSIVTYYPSGLHGVNIEEMVNVNNNYLLMTGTVGNDPFSLYSLTPNQTTPVLLEGETEGYTSLLEASNGALSASDEYTVGGYYFFRNASTGLSVTNGTASGTFTTSGISTDSGSGATGIVNNKMTFLGSDNKLYAWDGSSPTSYQVVSDSLTGKYITRAVQAGGRVFYFNQQYEPVHVSDLSGNNCYRIYPGRFEGLGFALNNNYIDFAEIQDGSFYAGVEPHLISSTFKLFTGVVSNDWNTAGNWQPAGVPAATDNVMIPQLNAASYPVISSGATCLNLTIYHSTLTINTGANLDVNGYVARPDATITGKGNITLKGPATTLYGSTSITNPNNPTDVFDVANVNINGTDVNFATQNETVNSVVTFLTDNKIVAPFTALTFSKKPFISGYNSSRYIITGANAGVTYSGAGSSTTTDSLFTIPMGTTASSFTPASFSYKFNDGPDFGVTLADGVDRSGAVGAAVTSGVLNKTWTITANTGQNKKVGVSLSWSNTADELTGFNRGASFMANYAGSQWTVNAAHAASFNNSLYTVSQNFTAPLSGQFIVSSNANLSPALSALAINSGTLSPVFSKATFAYTASVANAVASINITPATADPTCTITVNGVTVASGSAASVFLAAGTNNIPVIVTEQDGVTSQTYTLTIARALSTNANLSALQLSNGSLSPAFAPGTLTYIASVPNSIPSITLTPTTSDTSAAVTVNGTTVSSGSPSASLPLSLGANIISTVVTAQNGAIKTYKITVTRLKSADATLAGLALSAGTLSPVFSASAKNYTVSVSSSLTSIIVTPLANNANASIKVNGNTVTSGQASGPITVSFGTNTISAIVTAQNGTTTATYTITLTLSPGPPVISYSSPQTYLINTAIVPLSPTGNGVAAPAYGSPATIAPAFTNPNLVAVDIAGDIYVSDQGEKAVNKISTGAGGVTTVASGFTPAGVAIDAAGNVYVADYDNSAVKEIPANGESIFTLATGIMFPGGVAVDATGNVYVAQNNDYVIDKIPAGGGSPVAIASGFNGITGIAADAAGDIFIVDNGNHAVKEMPANGGSVVTLSTAIVTPYAIAIDALNDLYVTDETNNLVMEIPVGGGGPVTVASTGGFGSLLGVAIDGAGIIYFSDFRSKMVSRITPTGGYYITPALPAGLVFDATTGVISGTPVAVKPGTNYTVTAYNSYGSNAATLNLTVSLPPPPTLNYSSPQTYLVGFAISALSPASSNVAAPGYAADPVTLGSGFSYPAGVAADTAGNAYLVDLNNNAVKEIPKGGGAAITLGSGFSSPTGIAVDAAGNIYVTDAGHAAVKEIPAGGGAPVGIGSGFIAPYGIAVDAKGNVYVSDYGNSSVEKIPAGGGAPIVLSAVFNTPRGVAVDAAGNVYVADYHNNAIYKVPADGSSTVTVGSGFNNPNGVTVDAAGNLFVADEGNNAVKEIPAGGTAVITLASGFSGPAGVAVNAAGNVYVADSGNDAIKQIKPIGGYYIWPFLPAGLSFNTNSGIISGTPASISPSEGYTVTAYEGSQAASAMLSVSVAENVALSSLVFSAGALSPVFGPSTMAYTVNVSYGVSSVTVTPSAADPTATITVNGITVASGSSSAPIILNIGANPVTIVTTSSDGTLSDTYTVTVTRPLSADATLSSIGPGVGPLSPVFNPATTGYTLNVVNTHTTMTVKPVSNDPNATITVNGIAVASGTVSKLIQLPEGVQTLINVVVTAQDGTTTKTYTITVTRAASTDASLSNIQLSSGALSPVFLSSTTAYTAGVPNSNSTITVTPVSTDAHATIKVNGTGVISGTASGLIMLAEGAQTAINVTITAQDGATNKTYTITITRAASTDASLSNIQLSSGTLNPVFAGGTTSYTAGLPNSTSTITVTPVCTDAHATIKVNGAVVTSGSASGSIALIEGATTSINVAVTAQEGATTKTYTIAVTRAPSNIASLSAMNPSVGPLTPLFTSGTTIYTLSVPNSRTTITVAPVSTDANATLKVNGTAIASGTTSGSIALAEGAATAITVVVTAQDGTTTKTYTVTVARAPSSVAGLSNIQLSSGTLSPVFAGGTIGYTANVPYNTSSITLTPTAANANATVKVNGTAVTPGNASQSLPLVVGANKIALVVTAQDGTTTKTYTVTVKRTGSSIATLSGIGSSITPLTPAFSSNIYSYTLSVSNGTATMTVKPVTTDANATIKVNGAALISGTSSGPITLAEGTATAINVVVTAQDGTTIKTYTLTVTRGPSSIASLSNLQLSSGTLAPVFAASTTGYTAAVPNASATITITPTATDPNATITVNGATVASGTASVAVAIAEGARAAISVVVKAQNGTITKTYTITATRAPSGNATLTSMGPQFGPMTPVFASGTTSYALSVSNSAKSMTVKPTAADANATLKVNGTALTSGTTSAPIALAVGSNTISVAVTAQDGSTTKTYTITVTRASGGADSYTGISVTKPTETPAMAEDGIVIHQGISPNGDGVNDFLQIDNISQYPDNKLMIMNRNGQLIFETKGYDNGSKVFDGHSNKNGQMQLPGTYFYQLDYTVNGTTKHKTGFIVLKY